VTGKRGLRMFMSFGGLAVVWEMLRLRPQRKNLKGYSAQLGKEKRKSVGSPGINTLRSWEGKVSWEGKKYSQRGRSPCRVVVNDGGN